MRALFLILCGLAISLGPLAAEGAPAPVQVDQHGYAPSESKWVAVGTSAASFQVLRAANGTVAASGSLTLRRASDPASGDNVYQGDFSALTETGSFYVHVPGVGDSPTFTIQPGNYDDLYKRLLKGLY